MKQGQAAARSGQRARAARIFAAVLEMDPTCADAWRERAALLDDPQEALAHLAQALTLNPNDEQARLALRAFRRQAASTPVTPPVAYGSLAPHLPVPRPLAPMATSPAGRRSRSGAWAVLGAGLCILLLALLLWSDAPRTVVAALLPTATWTPTLSPTPTPTWTPSPTPTPTPTFTPSPTPTFTPSPMPTPSPTPTPVPADQSASGKWIEVDLSEQRLYAHEGQETVFSTLVSTGTRWYPTVTGRFKIYLKYRSTRMRGPGYDLPNVPWTMYFHGSYAIHGAYWHNNFGHPMSHGCINMRPHEARWLYHWAPKGTLVVVHP